MTRGDMEPAWRTADAVRRGEVSARSVVEAALERIERRNPALNAFTWVAAEEALRQAEAVDARVAAGVDPGPLAGVPIGVKDLEPVAGMPHTCGSRVYAGRIAMTDSLQVQRLRAAGAVVVGKTNTPEFGARAYTVNRLHGPTGNPWNPALTPGGSSGGSAAAVVAGMVPLATASDGGGSIRIPASWTGCFGIKPTLGRIPQAAESAPTWGVLSHLGPVASNVRDAARYLDVTVGPDAGDLAALDGTGHGFEAAVLGEPVRLRRIAWSETLGYAIVGRRIAGVARAAAGALAEAVGAELVELEHVFDDPVEVWTKLAAPGDLALMLRLSPADRDLLEPGFRKFAALGESVSAVDYIEALEQRHRLNRRLTSLFDEYDLLLTPTVAAPPFVKEGPPPREIDGRRVGPSGTTPFAYPFNLTGHPAASVPAGFDDQGMPVGLQVVGPRYADVRVLKACAAFEAVHPWPRTAPEPGA